MSMGFLVVHIICATLAFGFVIFFDFMLVATAKSRNLEAIRDTFPIALRTARWAGPLLLLAVIFGFAEAGVLRISAISGWLVATYVILFLAGILGINTTFRRHVRVLRAAMASHGDAASPDLDAAIAAERPIGAYVMIIAMILLVYLMTAKPF